MDTAVTPQTAPALLDFEGTWSLARRITDHMAGSTGTFEGTATFTRDGAGLAYHEVGLLHLHNHAPFHAERRYRWRDVDGDIEVCFADGRFFHSFSSIHPTASHWCDPDTYLVRYDFDRWPIWQSTWDVSGPQKAYRMVNAYCQKCT